MAKFEAMLYYSTFCMHEVEAEDAIVVIIKARKLPIEDWKDIDEAYEQK